MAPMRKGKGSGGNARMGSDKIGNVAPLSEDTHIPKIIDNPVW
jgi:hypothetical protein